jgi:hypothetical protein
MPLNTVEEIEQAIETLAPEQIEELYFLAGGVDAQLKADLEAGRMDDRINRALDDYKSGRTQPL